MNPTDKTEEKQNLKPWLYKKGQSGNPNGRPKGSKSMKTYVKERLQAMNEEEREEFLEGIDKKTLWEMSEGHPHQTTDTQVTFPENLIELFTNTKTNKGVEGENSD